VTLYESPPSFLKNAQGLAIARDMLILPHRWLKFIKDNRWSIWCLEHTPQMDPDA